MSVVGLKVVAWWQAQPARFAEDEGAEFLEVALWSLAILGVGAALAAIFQEQLTTLFEQIGG